MRTYRVELLLAVVCIAFYLVFAHWQTPGEKISPAEVAQYMQRLEDGVWMPQPDKAEFIAHLRAWAEADDGQAFYNFNLMRLYPEVHPLPAGVAPIAGTPEQVNAFYESVAMPLLFKLGAYPAVGGTAQVVRSTRLDSTNLVGFEAEVDRWSRMAAVRYPSRKAFLELLTDPRYLGVMPYKMASLKLVLVPVDSTIVIPDLRFVLASLLLSLFLLTGWFGSARRLSQLRKEQH